MLTDFAGVVQQGTREEALLAAVAWDRLPRHVAIIMDGNGRWAAQRHLPRVKGTGRVSTPSATPSNQPLDWASRS